MSTESSPHQGEKSPYLFNRDFRSSMRLNQNHFIWTRTVGSLIHPSISPPTSEQRLRIADVGTGTAIWALETAAQFPTSVHVTGFDISSDQFPANAYLPKNVTLTVHDCFKPFPPEHLGQYDIVNARAWLCIVNDPDAEPLLRNFSTLLKPGGYLQWLEPLPRSSRIVNPDPSLSTPAMDRMSASWHKPTETSSYNWVSPLSKTIASTLTSVAADIYPLPAQYRWIWIQSNIAGMDDMAHSSQVLSTAKYHSIQEWMKQVMDESARGAFQEIDFQWAVGRL